jgi:hypothetical protein
MPKTVAKKPRQKKLIRSIPARPKDWRDAIRLHLAKVPEVDAVFACQENGVIHVYSVVEEFCESYYKRLLKHEDLIEKAFPKMSFEFHTRAHQGREPHDAAPWDAESVFSR